MSIYWTAILAALQVASAAGDGDSDSRDDAGRDNELDTVTAVGTRTERSLSDIAATVSVIDDEDLEREITRDIADLVRFEPGVSVGGSGSRFGLSGFSIRGVGGNRVLTLVDGVRVPEEFSFGPFLSARRDFVDIDSLERAEIARGPISSLYGSDALGGVVAFTTKGPRDYLSDAGSRNRDWYGGARGGYSSADDSAVGSITLAAGDDRLAGMLLYTHRNGEETANGGRIGGTGPSRELADPQAIDTSSMVAKLAWAPAEAHEFTLTLDHFESDADTRVLSDYGTVSFGTVTDRRDAFDERERQRWSIAYSYSADAGLVDSISATAYRQASETTQVTDEDRTAPGRIQQSRTRTSRFEQDIDGAFVQFGKGFDAGSSSHYLSWGIDYWETANESLRNGGTFASDGSPVREFSPLPTRDFPLTEVTQLAYFLQDEIYLFNDRLILSPGVRYDRFEAQARADSIYENGNPGQPAPEDYTDSEFTAKLGAVLALSDRWSMYGRYSEGFRAPPYDDVNVGFTNFIGGYKTVPNAGLESERSKGYELGLRFGTESANVSVAFFHNDLEDFIESLALAPQFVTTGGIDPADGLLTFQSINRDNVEISGTELTGAIGLGSLSDRLEGLMLRASVAYAEGEDSESGAPINSIEPLTAVIGLGYTPASDRWGTELIVTAVDGKDEIDIDPLNPRLAADGYGIVDLLAHFSFSDRVRLNIGLFNLTDRRYLRWADTTGIGDDAAARFTQPGFNAGATLRVEL